MSRTTIIILVAAAVIVIFLVVRKMLSGNESVASAAQKRGNAPVLSDLKIISDTLLTYELQATGSIKANEEVDIVSELEGKITGIFFKEGSTVAKGALLFKLDDAELQAQKKKLEVENSLAVQNEQRIKVLHEKGGSSQQEYDAALNNLESINADLDVIKVQINKTDIRAPFSGKVGLRRISEGAYVSANTILTTLQDLSRVKVDFTLPEKYASLIQAGQQIIFTVENDTEVFEASVIATEPSVDRATRSIDVRAVTDNSARKLIPGTSSKIGITLQEDRKTVMVPTSALIPQSTGYKAYVLKDGKAQIRSVKTGYRDESNIQVIEGLNPGDSLLTTNLLMLRPDAQVKPVMQ